jgi:flagellar biosynthetic protein FliP
MNVTLDLGQTGSAVQLFLLVTVLSLAPAILVLMTSFTRIVVVLSFVRNALGTQQLPPTQVVIGLSLFLTFFVMGPTFTELKHFCASALFKATRSAKNRPR